MIAWIPVLSLLGCGGPSAPAPVHVDALTEQPAKAVPVPEPEPPLAPRGFTWAVQEIPDARKARMIGTSYREGCPTPLEDLRLLKLTHLDFDGEVVDGELVVHHEAVAPIRKAFEAAFEEGFRVRRMEPVSAYDGSDDASMAADNTSAFNCRKVKGTNTWSEHSSGKAIDVNPRENPWVRGDKVDPPEGREFLERDPAVVGLLVADGAMVRSFLESGWGWGGRWSSRKDYQHFSASGR